MRLLAPSALALLVFASACDKGSETAKDGTADPKASPSGEKPSEPEAEKAELPEAQGANANAEGAKEGEGHPNSVRPDDEQIYDERADAQKDVDLAIATAKRENKRVLIVYGGNWCPWCWKLHDTMEADAGIRNRLEESYVVVLVSIHENEDFPASYGAETKGFPYLSVLDGTGKPIVHQETGSLEEGDHHDPAKVLGFLDKYA